MELRNFTKSGGRTGTGREQRVFSDAGFWTISYEEIPIGDGPTVAAYRAMMARLRQGEPIVLKVFDLYPVPTSYNAKVVVAADQRATQVSIQGLNADVTEGKLFSIGQRLYQITQVLTEQVTIFGTNAGISGAGIWDDNTSWTDDMDFASTVSFLPPLRAAAMTNTIVRFNNLQCLCVLEDMEDGNLNLEYGRYGFPSVGFVEYI